MKGNTMKTKHISARFDFYKDTQHLAERLENLAYDEEANLSIHGRCNLIAARENLLGLYELCECLIEKVEKLKSKKLNNQNQKGATP